jgi:release factor glutamine methyltransferase
MATIKDIQLRYRRKIDALDLELLIAATIKKPREFVLAHPEYRLNSLKIENLKLKISRRMRDEPLAYILGKKEFFGLDLKVNKHTLIPRPETELLVEKVIKSKPRNNIIVDIGTGSGNIIIALAKKLKDVGGFIAIDISEKALGVAKQNAEIGAVNKKIKFLKGDLLSPVISNLQFLTGEKIVIVANLPYLSKSIYASAPPSVRKFEPRMALFSGRNGLANYKKLFSQIKLLVTNYELRVVTFIEISPEQKKKLGKLARDIFPAAKIAFHKDLAGKWRICEIIPRT